MDRIPWEKSAEHWGTAGHYRAPPEQQRQGWYCNLWNCGVWPFHLLVVPEHQLFSLIWGWGWSFGEADYCPAWKQHFLAWLGSWFSG